jgi:hypothetical protein
MCSISNGDEQDTHTGDREWQGKSSPGHEHCSDGRSCEDRQHRGEAPPQPWVVATCERGVRGDVSERQCQDGGGEIGNCELSHSGIAQPHRHGGRWPPHP